MKSESLRPHHFLKHLFVTLFTLCSKNGPNLRVYICGCGLRFYPAIRVSRQAACRRRARKLLTKHWGSLNACTGSGQKGPHELQRWRSTHRTRCRRPIYRAPCGRIYAALGHQNSNAVMGTILFLSGRWDSAGPRVATGRGVWGKDRMRRLARPTRGSRRNPYVYCVPLAHPFIAKTSYL